MDREELASALKRLASAVAPKPVAPALGAVFFDGEYAKAYDGEIAILTPCNLPLVVGVDFKLLSTWLSCAAVDEVAVKMAKNGNSVSFSCGRAKLKLPSLDAGQFVFEEPSKQGAVMLEASPEFTEGLRNVVAFAGDDRMHPTRMGVTVSVSGAFAKMYATDNVSCGFANAAVTSAAGAVEVQIPTRYVSSLLALVCSAPFVALELDGGFVQTEFDDGTELFGRVGSEVDVAAFDSMVDSTIAKVGAWFDVPVLLPLLLKQAKKMVGVSGGEYISIEVSGGLMSLASVGGNSASFSDALVVGGEVCGKVRVLSREVLLAVDGAEQMALGENLVAFRGPNFTHMVACLTG